MICAWVVTSRAVVASSAISSLGEQVSAIAIMTRCRMPPENWCGYSSYRCRRGQPHQLEQLDGPLIRASAGLHLRWARIASAICGPTFIVGFSDRDGSWKIIATSWPR